MSLDAITSEFQKRAAQVAPLGATLKIVLDDKVIFIDGKGDANQVSNEDAEADCTISTTSETFMALQSGDLNPMAAVMNGDIAIEGDMMVAMQLQGLM
ncbi:MAG: SCP2 sterol-binding domain-containing protein [Chitinophagales bacterium]